MKKEGSVNSLETTTKLTAENYFSPEMQMEYMGVSQYKDFLECPARALATIKGEYKEEMTKAMLVGSYVDAYFEGTLDKFKAEHPEIFNSRTGELKVDYQQANEIIKRLEADPIFMEHMSGEKQVIMTAELFGTKWKIKIDSYHPGKQIDDLKIVRSLERIMGISFVQHWGYDTQMAVYSEVEALSTGGDRLETYLDTATKEDPADVAIVHIPAWRRRECLSEVEKHMPRILAYKRGELEAPGCGVCPYCRGKKKASVIDFEMVGFSNKELAAMNGKSF